MLKVADTLFACGAMLAVWASATEETDHRQEKKSQNKCFDNIFPDQLVGLGFNTGVVKLHHKCNSKQTLIYHAHKLTKSSGMLRHEFWAAIEEAVMLLCGFWNASYLHSTHTIILKTMGQNSPKMWRKTIRGQHWIHLWANLSRMWTLIFTNCQTLNSWILLEDICAGYVRYKWILCVWFASKSPKLSVSVINPQKHESVTQTLH